MAGAERPPPPASLPALTALIAALIHALTTTVGDSNAYNEAINRAAAAALREARPAGGHVAGPRAAALSHLLTHFGFHGACFARPLDVRSLVSRLKSLMFDSLTHCGSGTYSTVFAARCLLTGRRVVLKRLKIGRGVEGVPATALREVSLLRQLEGSPHIVQLLDVLWDYSRLHFVFEAMGRDLRAHLDAQQAPLPLPDIKSIMYQVIKGVAHAHAHRVIHRDLKPANILLEPAIGDVKVADMGLARTLTPPLRPYTHEVVTLIYRPPELLLGSPTYSTPVDVWSIGCILAELATGQPLFYGESEIEHLLSIFNLLGTPGEAVWPGVSDLPDWQASFPQWRPRCLAEAVPRLDPPGMDLLHSMLAYDPSQRIRCRQALAHPWFDQVREVEEARGQRISAAVRQAQRERCTCMADVVASASHLLSSADPGTASQASAQTGEACLPSPTLAQTPQGPLAASGTGNTQQAGALVTKPKCDQ